MGGKPWEDLINAVKELINNIDSNLTLKDSISLSIYIYNDICTNIISDAKADSSLIAQLPSIANGGTNFENPLKSAYSNIKSSFAKFEKFVIGFMSDGQASFPNIAINTFKNDSEVMAKTDFRFIFFGTNDSSSLKPIADSFGAQLSVAISFEDLKSCFLEIINCLS